MTDNKSIMAGVIMVYNSNLGTIVVMIVVISMVVVAGLVVRMPRRLPHSGSSMKWL